MPTKSVASARRTQLVSTYGVGALLPSMDESFMVCGIDEWTESYATEVPEPRLARSLHVDTFRMPPSGGPRKRDVPVVRFPETYFCPECRRLARLSDFCSWDEHRCHDCSRDLTPSRFVVCCENGHIDEFPYFLWAHKGADRSGDGIHRLRLTARGRTSSLADIEISCSCGIRPVSMAGSFGQHALGGISSCRGRRPWLPGVEAQACDKLPRTLQRGSSNVWFAMVRSALSIPPWSEGVHRIVARHWPVFQAIPNEALETVIGAMNLATAEAPLDALVAAIRQRRGDVDEPAPEEEDLRRDEYAALVQGRVEKSPHQQFVCVQVPTTSPTSDYLSRVSKVSRLREVRALEGFTRVLPPMAGMEAGRKAVLSAGRSNWLPAIEVLGEGIFVTFDEQRLREWESGEFARDRAELVRRGAEVQAQTFGLAAAPKVTPRLLLLHSFAHLLLNELSLDAGYPAASLRERLFTDDDQAGVLIYTASADSAGSLGGLAAQSSADRMAGVLTSAVRRASWCTADPVCIEATSTGNDALNLAACHACLLLPETSCERMNNYLDRATVVGRPGAVELGFFGDLIEGG